MTKYAGTISLLNSERLLIKLQKNLRAHFFAALCTHTHQSMLRWQFDPRCSCVSLDPYCEASAGQRSRVYWLSRSAP